MIVLTVMSIFFVGLDARTLLAQDELFDVTAAQRAHGSVSELPFEHIDMSSGSVVLTFTDLVLPGNAGHDFVWQRTYSSRFDDPPGAGPGFSGWTFGMAGTVTSVVDSGNLGDITYPTLYKADGSLVTMRWLDSVCQLAGQQCYQWAITSEFAKYDRYNRVLYNPDGTWWKYDSAGRQIQAGDQFGQIVFDLAWSDAALQITQHVPPSGDRTIVLQRNNAGVFTFLEYAGKTWIYDWQPNLNVTVLNSVTLPGGSVWRYAYDDADATALKKVTTLNGGEVSYSYDMYAFPRADDPGLDAHIRSRVSKRAMWAGARLSEDTGTLPIRPLIWNGRRKSLPLITAPQTGGTIRPRACSRAEPSRTRREL